MKIVDEKGRLFGKLNLIDLLVILLAIALVFALVWKLGGSKAAEAVISNKYDVSYSVLFENTPKDICDYAESQIGDELVNNGQLIGATIASVDRSEGMDETHENLIVTVTGTAVFSSNVYKVGSQEVRVGYEYILKTSEFELTGIISDLEF